METARATVDYRELHGRCPNCRHVSRIVFDAGMPPKFYQCAGCRGLIPLGAYHVVMLSNYIEGMQYKQEVQ